MRIFEPEEEFGAECGPGHGGGYDSPADRGGDGISEAAPEGEIDAEPDRVGESFEEDVGVNVESPEVQMNGKVCGEME